MPEQPNILERRRFIRHPMCLPLKYKIIQKKIGRRNKEKAYITINISRAGLLFSAKEPVQSNSTIVIRIPFQQKIFNVKAKVIRCDKNTETNLYTIGVSFLKSTDAFKVKLIEQMYLISEYRDLRSIQLGKEISLQEASQEWIKHYSKRFEKLYW